MQGWFLPAILAVVFAGLGLDLLRLGERVGAAFGLVACVAFIALIFWNLIV